MSPEGYAWFLFGGFALLFMGLALALDAESRARSLTEWQRTYRSGLLPSGNGGQGGPAWPVWAYRAAGLLFVLSGLAVLAGLWLSPEALASRVRPPHLGTAGDLLGGLFLTFAGLWMGSMRMWEWGRRPRSAFEEELAAAEPRPSLSRRMASWSGWLLILSFLAFGSWLLARIALHGG